MKGHIRKRGSKWCFVLDLGRDEEGKRRQKWFSGYRTKKEAERAMAQTISEINSGTFKEPSTEKLEVYLRTWLENRKDKIKPSTYNMYNRSIELHIIPAIGQLRLDQLNDIHIDRFYRKLGKTHSKATVGGVHRVLKAALNRAKLSGFIMENPAAIVEPPGKPDRHFRVWDEIETTKFLEAARCDRLFIAFILAIYTGMRRGEILGLRWRDIDFDRKNISVMQTLSNDGKMFHDAKTNASHRLISIQSSTIKELQKHKTMIKQEKLVAGKLYENNDLVVCTRYGTKMLPRNLYRTWIRLMEAANVPRIRFHDLRHTHATLMLKQGIHPKIVSERLGHSSINVTLDTYTHVIPGLQESAAEKFEQMLSDVKNKTKTL